MNKRYQVFVSSTYTDLIEERRAVFETLLGMPCIPAGMEWFPAETEEQWNVIKRVIDDCDFYVLIIGGRYGSVTPDGLSYTEKEFDYAVQKMPVLVFCHENPSEIPFGKSEPDPEMRSRLEEFRKKAMTGRVVKFWTNPEGLAGRVSVAINNAIATQDAVGWVRANQVASSEALADLNRINKRNEQLAERNAELEAQLAATQVSIPNLAGLDETIKVTGTRGDRYSKYEWAANVTWNEIFAVIAPYLIEGHVMDSAVKSHLTAFFRERTKTSLSDNFALKDQDYQTVKVQLMALQLVTVEPLMTLTGALGQWSLTPQGEQLMFELRTVKTVTS